ncbi:hypothetical protein [Oceanobacillus halophilus]|uniref:Uncharacterized protein n=1 Tax=Oceanobacillus halophilus TaxID=930130 RepID=A0A495A2Z8_9BACI|nr:hypothetical protein [Oceanobacillus halophilus]RKQ33952.1 hypothetical protein D8M06_09020 [Oceanobacillus halophilus]
MLLELFNEMFYEFSPFYFYLSIALSLITIDIFYVNLEHKAFENQLYIRKSHDVKIQQLPRQIIIPRVIEIRNWITTKTKRIEAPDDDSDAHSFSLFPSIKYRGGKQWKQHLYSLLLKNIALL